jgi:hypothetical protein
VILARACLFVALSAGLAVAQPGAQRLWSFTTGQSLTGRFMWADPETLYLRDPTGKDLRMPVGLLGNADLEHVREIRDNLRARGILYEAPLTWESYHSKNVRPLDAEKAGAYPLDSQENAMGKLELEFMRFGSPPAPGPNQRIVLRMTTSPQRDAGTNSTVQVVLQGMVAGQAAEIGPNATFDIPLAPGVFAEAGPITMSVTCGRDTIHVRTGKSGAGPRLLIVEHKPN